MSAPEPSDEVRWPRIWQAGWQAGVRCEDENPPYPPGENFTEIIRNTWIDGYAAGLMFREDNGIRLRPRKWPTDDRRFWQYVDMRGKGECWLWAGVLSSEGYGMYEGSRAHRHAYVFVYGAIPDGHELHHTCLTRDCCNPKHLEALTPTEHKHRHRQSHCKRGHPYSGSNLHIEGGRRRCRACRNLRAERYRRAVGVRPRPTTHCYRGHLLSGANLYVTSNGRRQCRECARMRMSKRRAED